jgi:Family of unknown function (DUF5519)/Metallo-beta-lactamase superfamily
MTTTSTASAATRITEEVTSWPGVEAGTGRRGEWAFRVGRREIGHLHGDRSAHFAFPKDVWRELRAEGRIVPHPVFPDREGPAARRIEDERDVADVIALLRLNYDRVVARSEPFAELRATPPEALPFAPSVHIRSFVLGRRDGNVLLYSTTGVQEEGIVRHYLGHGHEAMFPSPSVGAPVFVHEDERAAVEEAYRVRGTFSRRHTLDGDLEVIPIPGHTSGSTAYLWDSGQHRFLFTADTIYLDDGEWVAAVLESSDRAAYFESLALLRELDFDVLVPWAATAGRPWFALTDREDANRRIGAIIDRLWRGEDR